MDSIDKDQLGVIVYKDAVIDLGKIPKEQVEQFKAMTEEEKQRWLEEIYLSIPDADKKTYGFCKSMRNGKHVSYIECMNCALDIQHMKTISEWNSCIEINLTR